jgi:hypothetical protein
MPTILNPRRWDVFTNDVGGLGLAKAAEANARCRRATEIDWANLLLISSATSQASISSMDNLSDPISETSPAVFRLLKALNKSASCKVANTESLVAKARTRSTSDDKPYDPSHIVPAGHLATRRTGLAVTMVKALL